MDDENKKALNNYQYIRYIDGSVSIVEDIFLKEPFFHALSDNLNIKDLVHYRINKNILIFKDINNDIKIEIQFSKPIFEIIYKNKFNKDVSITINMENFYTETGILGFYLNHYYNGLFSEENYFKCLNVISIDFGILLFDIEREIAELNGK